MSKMDQQHPLALWLKAQGMTAHSLSKQLGRSGSCVSRWISGARGIDAMDKEAIAELTKGPTGVPAVPVSVWHEWDVKRARAAEREAA